MKISGMLQRTKMDRSVSSPRNLALLFLIPAGKR